MAKLDYIIDYISSRNVIHHKKLKKNLGGLGGLYESRAEQALTRYEQLLAQDGKTLDYAIDCYLQMLADYLVETMRFRETGAYTSKSFAEVNARVYANPAVMEYYMHGLMLSQFLWKHHYEMFCFFSEVLAGHQATVKSYLEIGCGHGFQVAEAVRVLDPAATITVVDISPTSLELARRHVADERAQFVLCDVFQYEVEKPFDFITIGEVIEHLEDPAAMLRRAAGLLADDGTLFLTAPANAPAIDHIHLFRNAAEIRDLIQATGFRITAEFFRYAEEVPPEVAEKHKIALLYGAALKKNPTA